MFLLTISFLPPVPLKRFGGVGGVGRSGGEVDDSREVFEGGLPSEPPVQYCVEFKIGVKSDKIIC